MGWTSSRSPTRTRSTAASRSRISRTVRLRQAHRQVRALTASNPILCFGITPEQHEWLTGHRHGVEELAGYLDDRQIAAALAHPFRTLTTPLTAEQRHTLGTLFRLWETRNGAQPPEINAPAAAIVESIGGGAIAGSGDRTGENVGKTWTKTPYAATTDELLGHLRAGRVTPHGIERTPVAPSARHTHTYELRRRTSSDPPTLATVVTGGVSDPALARTLDELRARAVPGHAIEFTDTLTRARGDLIHLCGSGEAADRAAQIADSAAIPLVSSFGSALHHSSRLVLSPSQAADQQLIALGIDPSRIRRWELGVNPEPFSPAHYHPAAMPAAGDGAGARINLLYSGPLDEDHEVGLLTDAFQLAHERDPRLHLVLAGSGPDEAELRRRLGVTATFRGPLDGDTLAQAYASADLLVCPSADGYGQPILYAQASGLPVLAVGDGAAAELIQSGRNGCLVPASTLALAEAMRSLARRATLRERLATGGLLATRERTWERSLRQLAAAWSDALAPDPASEVAHAA